MCNQSPSNIHDDTADSGTFDKNSLKSWFKGVSDSRKRLISPERASAVWYITVLKNKIKIRKDETLNYFHLKVKS